MYTTIMRQMYLFSFWDSYFYLIGFSISFAIIPGAMGGLILNYFSLKEIEREILKFKNSILRGIGIGFICGLLISIAMYPEEFLRIRYWRMDNHFIFLSGFMVSLIGATTGGSVGYLIHSDNLRKQ